MWASLFRAMAGIGRSLVASGAIVREDLDAREPYLYIGLPSLTVLQALLRSGPGAAGGITLIGGVVITADTCPPEAAALYLTLMRAKAALAGCGTLRRADRAFLRHGVLFAGAAPTSEPSVVSAGVEAAEAEGGAPGARGAVAAVAACVVAPAREVELRRIVAVVQGVGTEVTQRPFYKTHMEALLEQLSRDP